MNSSALRELQLLKEIAVEPQITQRSLAKKYGVALGLTNLLVRRLVKKGYVKAVNVRRNRIRYLITPKGIAEKTRLTYEYLEYSLYLYRKVREVLKENLGRVAQSGHARIVFFGTGEIAEIAYLTLKELGLDLTGVVDDRTAGKTFLGFPIMSSDVLPTLAFDVGIVSSLNGGLHELRQRYQQLGISGEKLLVLEQRGALIRAVPGDLEPVGEMTAGV